MASRVDGPGAAPGSKPPKRGLFSPEVVDLVVPPLRVGAWSGAAGSLVGVGFAVFNDANPLVGGAFNGIHWFSFGATFWFTRRVLIRSLSGEERMRPHDKVQATAVAATAAGAISGLMFGPRRILPTMVLWGLAGAGGQLVANRFAAREPKVASENNSSWPKWFPLKKLTDQEYMDNMAEKILRVEADIALIDEKIAELEGSRAEGQGAGRGECKAARENLMHMDAHERQSQFVAEGTG